MTASQIFEGSWDAVPANVPAARHAVIAHLAAARTPDPPLNDVGLVVSEAVTNIVHHAYRDGARGRMHVRVAVGADEIEVTVRDEGGGMVPRPDTPGLGLGMPLIAMLSDRFDVLTPAEGGTRLSMWFRADSSAATLAG